MTGFQTASEFRAAFDALLAGAPRELRVYDHDLSVFDLDQTARHGVLRRALCVAGGGRRVELLLDDLSLVASRHPRLMQLLRDFGHIIEIRRADPEAPRPEQAFVLADRRGVLLRADKAATPGVHRPDDPAGAAALNQSFEGMWQRSPAGVAATTLGL